MRVKVKKLSAILIASLLLTACQGSREDNKPSEPAETTTRDTPAVTKSTNTTENNGTSNHSNHNHGHHDHNHGPGEEQASSNENRTPYREIEPQYDCKQPVVIEFYAYQCPHCYELEPSAEAWIKKNKDKVNFVSVPTHLGHEAFQVLLLVHNAAKKLGILDKTKPALFKRIHIDNKSFASPEAAAEFLAEQGANREEALAMLNNQDEIVAEIKKDFEMMTKYKITHVPQILVNHRYMTDISLAGGRTEVFKQVDKMLKLPHSCGG